MALTAREWLLLPKNEQEKRKDELSDKECRILRMELGMIHLSEEEKVTMSEEERVAFVHIEERTEEEKKRYNEKCKEIFQKMMNKV